MADRTPRDLETREQTARDSWRPPSMLPDPTPQTGYHFRWVRTANAGTSDHANMSSRLRQGYEPVKAEDHPELKLFGDTSARFPGSVEVGGLILCKVPDETVAQRNAYYTGMARAQITSVDNNLMRENDPRMPLLPPERSSKTTFGSGR